jgi:cell division protein FtsL
MDTIIFLIYIISLISAMTALWVWYSNSDSRDQIQLLKDQNRRLQIKLEELEKFSKLTASAQSYGLHKKR